MDELQRIKMQNQSLRQELSSVRGAHQLALLELSQARDNQKKYKQLNDALILSIENNQVDLGKLRNISLDIKGSFGCSNCSVLEAELDNYRAGVNQSVERRVKEIARNLNQFDQEDSKKSRKSAGKNNNFFINLSIKGKECQNCKQLSNLLDTSNEAIDQANSHIKQIDEERDILNRELYDAQLLVNNLKKQNSLLQSQLNKLNNQLGQNNLNNQPQQQQNQNLPSWNYPRYPSESNVQTSHYKQKSRHLDSGQHKKEERMMRQITNIISCISTKEGDDGRGSRSRASTLRDNSALFSIKNGINRPERHYY